MTPQLPGVALNSHPAFAVIGQDNSKSPHLFAAFRYRPTQADDSWTRISQLCLKSWRVTAAAYVGRVEETGFKGGDVVLRLNEHGAAALPQTPVEDSKVTKNRHVTDVTEILALVALDELIGPVTFPYPGVLHHDSERAQHKGIDLVGYIEDDEQYALLIAEVMATTEKQGKTPKTVKDHKSQLLDGTLGQAGLQRLMYSLRAVHDEASEAEKEVLNAFITAALDGSLTSEGAILASPVLVRKNGKFDAVDWQPFLDSVSSFEQAIAPSTVVFIAVEGCDSYSGLLDAVKAELCRPASEQATGPADADA